MISIDKKIDYINMYILYIQKQTLFKMGNHLSNATSLTSSQECLICWESVDHAKWTQCVRCKIKMHDYCEEICRNEKEYTKCPHCQRKG